MLCVCLQKVLKEELGEKWRDQLADFDPQPLAAASIGQVHSVVLHSGQSAAMKIQVLRVLHVIASMYVCNLCTLGNIINPVCFLYKACQVFS